MTLSSAKILPGGYVNWLEIPHLSTNRRVGPFWLLFYISEAVVQCTFYTTKMDISSKALWKARRSAIRAKTFVPCVSCLAYARKCSEFRPCARCSHTSSVCTIVYGTTKTIKSNVSKMSASSCVDRPIKTSHLLELVPLDNFVPVNKYMFELGWGYEQLIKFSARGHPVESLTKFLTSKYFVHNLSNIAYSVQCSKNIAASLTVTISCPTAPSLDEGELINDTETSIGFVSISFDSVSGKRRQVLANSYMAILLGMHNEEYLARTANRDLAFPYTALDSLCLFLYISVRDSFPTSSPRELYTRMQSRVGSARRGILVVSRGITVVNHLTQSSEVKFSRGFIFEMNRNSTQWVYF